MSGSAPPVTPPTHDGVEVSVVVPVFNEEGCLREFHSRMTTVLAANCRRSEIVYVDDGSSDQSPQILGEFHASSSNVVVLTLSRNFGHQTAITAGMDRATGDAVVVIDSDLQDPPEVVADLIREWRAGADVVHAIRGERHGETRFKLWTASVFYRLIRRLTELDIQLDAGDFRLMDRKVVNAVSTMRERHRFVRGMVAWSGFRQVGVSYTRQERFAGTTKYPLKRMVRLAMNAITSFSFLPLQIASLVGFVTFALALLLLPVVLVLRLAGSPFFGGQTTVLLFVLLLGGLQMCFLGIIGEYLGRVVEESKGRPLYIVSGVHATAADEGIEAHEGEQRHEGEGEPEAVGGVPAELGHEPVTVVDRDRPETVDG